MAPLPANCGWQCAMHFLYKGTWITLVLTGLHVQLVRRHMYSLFDNRVAQHFCFCLTRVWHATMTLAAERRQRLKPLPPHKRLSSRELGALGDKVFCGEWFNIPIPPSLDCLKCEAFGAPWLTAAFHAAGTLPVENTVAAITSFVELELQGDNAQGGAGMKALLTVEYSDQSDPNLHQCLFVKVPWKFEENATWRANLSSNGGDGDGRELSVSVLAEDLVPVRIPKLYFGDISRESSNYVLITECIPFGEADPFYDGREVLPKCGKYQDDRLGNAQDYYIALMRSLARLAAADKRGVFDTIIDSFVNSKLPQKRRPTPDTASRRSVSRDWTGQQVDALVDFQRLAPNLFGRELTEPVFIQDLRTQLIELSQYFTAVTNWVAADENYSALAHPNLQIDNAFFYSDGAGGLEAGLLDWYGTTRAPFASIFLGCLSGASQEVLSQHLEAFMTCFVNEYALAGGPSISADVLLLQFQLLSVQSLVGSFSFIESDILKEGPPHEEWASIESKDDFRVMGRWNVRCRTIAILQQLKFWKDQDLYSRMVAWADTQGGLQLASGTRKP